jgi:SAM (Sterile alpha motif) domain-containing protein
MDVGDWLRSLSLSQYETLFRQNDIDAEVLSELTDGDLENSACPSGIASDFSRQSQLSAMNRPSSSRLTPLRGRHHSKPTQPSVANSR